MILPEGKLIPIGKISGVHGVAGWVKVFSDTQPRENIFEYQPWSLAIGAQGRRVKQKPHSAPSGVEYEVLSWRKQGKTLIARLKGVDDRNAATELIGTPILIAQAKLPKLDVGDFYWSQLIGLRVETRVADQILDIGVVDGFIETGANDVLVVKGDSDSLDMSERLIPWVPDQYILDVDLISARVKVDWDPEF